MLAARARQERVSFASTRGLTPLLSPCVFFPRYHRLPSSSSLLKWCLSNQGSGFRGRPNKVPDSCYSFWVGATLRLVAREIDQPVWEWTNKEANRGFNLECQSDMGGEEARVIARAVQVMGDGWAPKSHLSLASLCRAHFFPPPPSSCVTGFSKIPGPYFPDLLHSYFGVCGLSLVGADQQLEQLDCMLGLTKRVRHKHERRRRAKEMVCVREQVDSSRSLSFVSLHRLPATTTARSTDRGERALSRASHVSRATLSSVFR